MIRPIPGVRGAQAYLYRGEGASAVIDPGYTGSYKAILRFFEAEGIPRKLDWVILTHHHIDHAGTALALCEITGAQLAIHQADALYLKKGRPRERMTLWGLVERLPARVMPYFVSCVGCEVSELEEGDSIVGLQVLHAPGHTPGSICLWSEPESALFAGDVLNNERGIRTPPWTVNHSHAMAVEAPERIGELRFEQAYFGHGRPILERADEQVRDFLTRRRVRREGPGKRERLTKHELAPRDDHG